MSFSIKSEKYESMKEDFEKASSIIKRAINAERPVIIRHHNDPDGICAGIVMENACSKLMQKALVKTHFNLFRSSCRAPYYDFSDFLKDLNSIKRTKSRSGKNPLVIILDNGSTAEDYFALKCLKDSDIEVIVIDHHAPEIVGEGVSKNCEFLSAHINPHLRGFGSELCAGMLAFELANLLVPTEEFIFPAVAGVDDRVNGIEIEEYIQKSSKDRDYLKKIATALDFMVFNSKFDLDLQVLEEIFYNSNLVETIMSEVNVLEQIKFNSVKQSLVQEKVNGINFITLDIENYSERFVYPRTGKLTELILDENSNSFVVSIVGESITIRESECYISINDLILKLKSKLPFANINGGGHATAGTISFVRAYKDDVLLQIKSILSEK